MITLENKVVLVRYNTDYPENSPKRWRVLVGEISFDEELKIEKMDEGEAYAVDHINAVCSVSTWSGLVPSGLYKHHMLFNAEHFDVLESADGIAVAIIGTIVQDTKEEVAEEPTPVNPETEVGNEEPQADTEVIKDEE